MKPAEAKKPVFSAKWWMTKKPDGLKTPELEKALAAYEKAVKNLAAEKKFDDSILGRLNELSRAAIAVQKAATKLKNAVDKKTNPEVHQCMEQYLKLSTDIAKDAKQCEQQAAAAAKLDSLQDAVKDKSFQAFCKKERKAEEVEFVSAMLAKRMKGDQKDYEKFIADKARLKVNISSKLKKSFDVIAGNNEPPAKKWANAPWKEAAKEAGADLKETLAKFKKQAGKDPVTKLVKSLP